jgi:drug/metabolite transporter (DMT)-like permease
MKTTFRIILIFSGAIASFYIVALLVYLLIHDMNHSVPVSVLISLIITLLILIFLWKKTENGLVPKNLGPWMLIGGCAIGFIAFIFGFFGPMIFSPTSNQGPLLGILVTGPFGFLIGVIAGMLFWRFKVKNK